MTTYVQHKQANQIHIYRETWTNGEIGTYCGKWYWPSMAFVPYVRGEREQDVVCPECRRKAAAAVGKKVYYRPTLRRGLSKAKQGKLNADAVMREHRERQRLAAWNRAAMEAQR